MKRLKQAVVCAIVLTVAALCVYLLPTEVDAATEGYYTYSVSGGKATITSVSSSISGKVVIPSTLGGYPVTSIGDYAFENCTGLTSITIPNSVTSIGDYAFEDCTRLTSITIPDNVTSIGGGAFDGCEGLTTLNFNAIKCITSAWLGDCKKLTTVNIGEKVTQIPSWAFRACTGLTSITIPDSVTSIGDYAFSRCTGLKSITIDNGVTSIGDYAFEDCTGLTEITIPDSVTSIGWYAFRSCTGLTEITIPDSVTSIGHDAFSDCSRLEYTWYGDGKYLGNKNNPYVYLAEITPSTISSFTIPKGTKVIGASAFENCTNLKSVSIPNSVTYIGSSAFENCTGLTEITIPKSVIYINSNAFSGCSGLTSITIPFVGYKRNGPKYPLGEIFGKDYYEGSELCRQKHPNWGIVDYYFPANLKSVTITDSTIIPERAFYDCWFLEEITISNTVKSIERNAFFGCWGLKRVYLHKYPSCTSEGNTYYLNAVKVYCKPEWDDGVVTKEATCKEEGIKTFTCSICGSTKQESVTKHSTHTWDNDCDAECNICETTRTISHIYDNACDTKCNICGDSRVITHEYSTWWSKDADSHWHTCVICGEKGEVIAHIPGAPATETTPQRCEACSYVIKWPDGFTYIPGDADGDGEVTDWDGVTLARYLAGWPVEVEPLALDIDGDGEVTDWDGVLMDRYLAGWDITIG